MLSNPDRLILQHMLDTETNKPGYRLSSWYFTLCVTLLDRYFDATFATLDCLWSSKGTNNQINIVLYVRCFWLESVLCHVKSVMCVTCLFCTLCYLCVQCWRLKHVKTESSLWSVQLFKFSSIICLFFYLSSFTCLNVFISVFQDFFFFNRRPSEWRVFTLWSL